MSIKPQGPKDTATVSRIVVRNCDMKVSTRKLERLRTIIKRHTGGSVSFKFSEQE